MKQILVFIFDGYADWEPAYVCAQLNAPGTGYAVKTIGLDRAPKVSMGGFRVTPDFTVADYPRDAGLLLLTGGTNPRLRTIKGRHISLRRRRFVTTAFLPPTDSERWSWQKRYCGC